MNINWFEIIAQIINFFIILIILQKLLYKPVLNAMKTRQERIQKSQKEAEEKMEEANNLIQEYDKKMKDIQKEKRDILEDARSEAHEKKENLLDEYKQEAENKRKAFLKEIEDEKENFKNNLRVRLGKSAVKLASHILDTLSSKDLEKEVFNTFLSNLKAINQSDSDIDVEKEQSAEIISSRNMTDDEKEQVENVLKEQFTKLKDIKYTIESDLIIGYELTLDTYTIHTNIRKYLKEIEKDIVKNLDTN